MRKIYVVALAGLTGLLFLPLTSCNLFRPNITGNWEVTTNVGSSNNTGIIPTGTGSTLTFTLTDTDGVVSITNFKAITGSSSIQNATWNTGSGTNTYNSFSGSISGSNTGSGLTSIKVEFSGDFKPDGRSGNGAFTETVITSTPTTATATGSYATTKK